MFSVEPILQVNCSAPYDIMLFYTLIIILHSQKQGVVIGQNAAVLKHLAKDRVQCVLDALVLCISRDFTYGHFQEWI